MSIAQFATALQTGGNLSHPNNSPAAEFFVVALLAVVLGLIVLILVRTNAGRSTKR